MISPIRINLASYQYLNHRVAYLLMALCLLFLMVVTGCNLMLRNQHNREIAFFEQKLKLLSAQKESENRANQHQQQAVDPAELEGVKRQVRFVNRLIAKDVFPWTRVLGVLEEGMPEAIFFENLTFKTGPFLVSVNGYANSMSEVSGYMKQKKADKLFKRIELKEIQVAPDAGTAPDGRPPVSFQIEGELDLAAVMPESVYGHLWQTLAASEKEEK